MNEPHGLARELRAILPFLPIMLIAGLVVVFLSNNGSADAGKGAPPLPLAGETATPTPTESSTATATLTPTVTRSPTASNTATASSTATATPSRTGTPTASPTHTSTPVPATIHGQVLGDPTGGSCAITGTLPLSYTSITIVGVPPVGSPVQTTTNASGFYTATGVVPGMVNVTALYYDYSVFGPQTKQVTLTAGTYITMDFCLVPPTPTPIPTSTNTPTWTPTSVATDTPTPIYTDTPTPIPTDTATPTPTQTVVVTNTVASALTTIEAGAGGQKGIIAASTGGTISTQDGRVTVIVPAGAADDSITVVIAPRSASDAASAPSSFRLGSNVFSVEAYRGGTPLTSFQQPIQIRAKYGSADLAAANGDPNRLGMAYYSASSRIWLPNSARVWPEDTVVEASVTQPALFSVVIGQTALANATPVPVSPRMLPRTGDGVDWTMALFIAGMASVMAGMVVRQLGQTSKVE